MIQTVIQNKIEIKASYRKHLADTVTPVTLFLKVRDHFTHPVLLESNDFRNKEDCHSFIGLDDLATFQVQDGIIKTTLPNQESTEEKVVAKNQVADAFKAFLEQFDVETPEGFKGFNGLFGHTNFDAVQYFDSLDFDPQKRKMDIPDMRYTLYRYIIGITHFKDELYLLENLAEGMESNIDEVERLIKAQTFSTFDFELEGGEESNLNDEEFKDLVKIGKEHCQRGDVFQIVFSRQFSQKFKGDEFNVYRVLRSINPSPYLFYFDYGSYKIFGSSPEAQMVIKDGVATVNPIAGTYKRSGDEHEDAQGAIDLAKDPKENAEHIMLVDLARNDLGRHSEKVTVKELKEIQFFSHVIHLVSKVEGDLSPETNPIQVFGDTFPAGTLSGAPKYRAIQLINQYENQNRSFYGGGIGFIDFNGNMNQAILIRSFMSKQNTLYYQAGAGVVISSVPESELQEVNNKLGALTKALKAAEKL